MRTFEFTRKNKILFYSRYFLDKIFSLWFEVKYPKAKVFLFEFLYSIEKLVHLKLFLKILPKDIDRIETIFGTYALRKGTEDVICASPAFERPDINLLLSMISKDVARNHKILFVDIGADFGTYSVTVGNKFSTYKNLNIVAFEPSSSSFSLLNENIKLNCLGKVVTTVNLALSDKDGQELILNFNKVNPGGSSARVEKSHSDSVDMRINTITFDTYFKDKINEYDVVFLKIDVEGYESKVFDGGRLIFNSCTPTYILVEDCVDVSVIDYLMEKKTDFLEKITPYNSFWKVNYT